MLLPGYCAMVAVALVSAALELLPAVWRYRKSALGHGVVRIVAFLVFIGVAEAVPIIVAAYAGWPVAFIAGAMAIGAIAIMLLLWAIRGLSRSDFE